jgi:hypothetical protein
MATVVLYLDASSIYMKEHFYGGKPDTATMPSTEIHRTFFEEKFFDMAWATLAMIYFPIQNTYTQLAVTSVLLGGGAPKVFYLASTEACQLTGGRTGRQYLEPTLWK